MKFLVRILAILVIIWLIMLVTGYGVLTGSSKNVAGLGLKCQYLTARGMVSSQYLHSDSGVVGVSECPVLKKSSEVVDNN
ncbi:hypothetical protein BTJ39_08860 [Izhakiella australiensis]|uniref:Uncharacterized protein YobH n=1 Tax=Izhakiella australiensis TaxID=1926881 RepID=A0A1S8YNW8_9GAMM|nr:YobH family protein [Izhakiella australiensis]OON40507.1 hypothetical protein BTJ39_08860 [Izhakiella australiensis]